VKKKEKKHKVQFSPDLTSSRKAHLSLLTHYGMIIKPSRTVDKSLTDLTAAEEQEQEAENEHKCAAE
jgi:hypothetical protein